MSWTQSQYDEYQRRRAKTGDQRIRATQSERTAGVPLERVAPGKNQGAPGAHRRVTITYRVFSQRPLDWDNYRLKDIQDCLIEAGILLGDDWGVLQGQVISNKAHSKTEEKTEIDITPAVPGMEQ